MDIIQIPTTQNPGAGLGDVVGPASATDNAIVRYDATTGRLLQNSTVTIADSTGAIAGATSLTSPASTNLTLTSGLVGTNKVNFPDTLTASSSTAGAVTIGNGTAATNVAIGGGKVNIGDTTAGSSGAGALIVAGGISAGAASYFGGAVTVSGDLFGSYSASGAVKLTNSNGIGGIFGYSDAGTTTQWYIASDATNLLIGTGTALPVAIRTNGVNALTISTTQNATFAGAVTAQRLEAVDAAANNRAAAFFRTQNNTTYSSSVLSIQGDRTTTNASYNLINAINGASTGVFAVRDSGNALNTNNSYGSASDRKLKENIVDATSKLEKLNQVRIVNFNRIGNEQKQLGVIAQELEQIFPSMIEEVIDRDAEGNDLGTTTKSVKYSVFVPMLIKAVQELTARLAAVEAK